MLMRKRILAVTLALAAAFMMTTSISSLAAAEATTNTEAATEEKVAAAEEITGEVTEEQALEIALKHAEYTKEEAEDVVIEKGTEDGNPVYEVEFYVGVSKFDYEIDIATGKILEYEVDD